MKILNPESKALLSPYRRNLFAFISLVVLILTIYSNTFDASWHFDDRQNIQLNKQLHMDKLNWQNIKNSFFASTDGKKQLYRPTACFSFALNYYFGKFEVFGYHLVNTTIHILASMFLFLFIYQTLNLPLLRQKYGSDAYFIAFLSAVFWAVNPVQIQAVTYIVQRMSSMAAMFFILSMYLYVKGRICEKRSRKNIYFVACLFSGVLAFCSKENAIMLPFCIFIYDILFIQGLTKDSIKKNIQIFLILIFISVVLSLILYGFSNFDPSRILKIYDSARPFTMWERLFTEPRIILFYLSLLLYPMPHRLSITHDVSLSHSLIDPPTTIIAILVILGVLGACVLKSKKWPFISFCIIFFFMNHLIEGSVFGLELIFEHRNYLPSMLLFAPLAVLLVKGIRYYSSRQMMQVIISGFTVLLLIGFGNSTYLRNFDWKTEGTLWADAAEKAPKGMRPHMNLGNFYYGQKMYDKGLALLMEATLKDAPNRTIEPGLLNYNIGLINHREGNIDTALEYYQKSAAIYPSYADTHNNMGTALHKKGQKEEAEIELKKAIRCDEKHIKAHRNLALFSLKDGHLDKAVFWINRALEIAPDNVTVLGAAGYCYRLKGSFGRAFALFEKTLSYDRYDPKVDLYIAEIFFKRKMYEQAIKHIEKFAAGAKGKDIRGYVQGTYKEEDEIEAIRTYKKMVLFALSRSYENTSSYFNEKSDYVKNILAEIE